MKLRAALALMPLLGACGPGAAGGDTAPATAPPGSPAGTPAARPTRDVLDATLAELGVSRRQGVLSARELRANRGLMPGESAGQAEEGDAPLDVTSAPTPDPAATSGAAAGPLDPEMVEFRDGLVGMALSDPRYLKTALADVVAASAELSPSMAAGLRERDRPADELKVLMQFARAAPSATVAGALAELTLTHDDPTVRAFASWALVPTGEADGSGAVVTTLLRRLKYEKDTQALIWAARALASHGNLSGLAALSAIASGPASDDAAAANQQFYEVVRATVGRDDVTVEDANGVMVDWAAGRVDRPSPAPDALRASVWRLISDLSGEHFQLRGVDDARFILSRLGPWAAAELGAALEDEDDYVRLHVTQVLERMGQRGAGAAPSLRLALHDRSDAVAGAAAEALAAVAPGACLPALLARLDEGPPHEVRVAIIRAAGRSAKAPAPLLLESFREAGAPTDLRLAAAAGLLGAGLDADLGAGDEAEVLTWLADTMTRSFGDPAGAEALVGAWVGNIEGTGGDELRAAWSELGPRQAIIHTAEQASARRSGRAALLRGHLAGSR